MKKKVGFVCDISKKIGYGHFFRQLNFSDYFPDKFFDKRIFILNKKNSFKVFSNLKEKRVHFVNYFTNKNRQFSNLLIKEKIDILISDISHPENIRKKKFLTKYHLFLKKKNIFSISFDEPTQKLTSDLSIVPLPIDNINLSKNKKTNVLKGIKYIIFPKNFKKVKRKLISKVSKKIFIFISGTDEKKIFFKISKILIKINFPLILKIYTGPQKKLSFYKKKLLLMNNNNHKFEFIEHISDIKKVLNWCDSAVLGEGLVRFEAAVNGVPSIFINSSDFSKINANLIKSYIKLKTSYFISNTDLKNEERTSKKIEKYFLNKQKRLLHSRNGLKKFDTNGAKRIIKNIKKKLAIQDSRV